MIETMDRVYYVQRFYVVLGLTYPKFLAAPSVGWAVECLGRRGYFWGSLLPRWFDTDGLLMQRLCHTPDWDGAQILLDRSREIFRIVREDWERSIRQQDGIVC